MTETTLSDSQFIAHIEELNRLCNDCDDLGIDRTGIRDGMDRLFPEFPRRIEAKSDPQLAMPLVRALHSFIYGRADDRGPALWRDTLVAMCSRVVDSYRRCPLIHSADYLFALDKHIRFSGSATESDLREYQDIIASYLEDIDTLPLPEKIRRVEAYKLSHHLFLSPDWERWKQIAELLEYETA